MNNYSKIFKLGSVCLLLACAVVAAYSYFARNKENNAGASPSCSYSDKSFCVSESAFRTYVDHNNFSAILEAQDPTDVVCTPSAAQQSYCIGAQTNITIQVFQVQQGGAPQLLTRNNYINLFRAYAKQHGPFNFSGDSAQDSGVQMNFTSKDNSSYSLLFKKIDNTWHFVYPVVN
jgi:hypothetical protein